VRIIGFEDLPAGSVAAVAIHLMQWSTLETIFFLLILALLGWALCSG
jgi:hypothetical protein